MARKKNESLTTDAAKQKLRAAASNVGIGPWVRRQPLGSVATGLLTGFLLGRVPHFWRHFSKSRMGHKMFDHLV